MYSIDDKLPLGIIFLFVVLLLFYFPLSQSWARGIVVNGPISKEIGMNSAIGAMGPFNEANSTIGRAYILMSKNLGNSRPGVTYMGTQGNPFNYNIITGFQHPAAQKISS